MKHTNIKLLTIGSIISLVGVANAAWVYSGETNTSTSLSVKVAPYISEEHDITIQGEENLYLILDKEIKWGRVSDNGNITASDNTKLSPLTEGDGVSACHIDKNSNKVIPDDTSKYNKYWEMKIIREVYSNDKGWETAPLGCIFNLKGATENAYLYTISKTENWENNVNIDLPEFVYHSQYSNPSKEDVEKWQDSAKYRITITFTFYATTL